jgi:hypothetical protein
MLRLCLGKDGGEPKQKDTAVPERAIEYQSTRSIISKVTLINVHDNGRAAAARARSNGSPLRVAFSSGRDSDAAVGAALS